MFWLRNKKIFFWYELLIKGLNPAPELDSKDSIIIYSAEKRSSSPQGTIFNYQTKWFLYIRSFVIKKIILPPSSKNEIFESNRSTFWRKRSKKQWHNLFKNYLNHIFKLINTILILTFSSRALTNTWILSQWYFKWFYYLIKLYSS